MSAARAAAIYDVTTPSKYKNVKVWRFAYCNEFVISATVKVNITPILILTPSTLRRPQAPLFQLLFVRDILKIGPSM